MGNNPIDHRPARPFNFTLFLILVYLIIGALFLIPNPTLRQPTSQEHSQFQTEYKRLSFRDEAIMLGKRTDKFDELLNRIKNDLDKNDIQIKVYTGLYFRYYTINGLLVPPDPLNFDKTYLILLDDDLLSRLDPKEQEAIVAHETGHLLFRPIGLDLKDVIEAQVRADTFSLKYVDPQNFLTMLDKLNIEHTTRRKNIEELIKSR